MEAHVALLTWNHACSVGVRAMDDQHGILMDTMNELRLAVVRGLGGNRSARCWTGSSSSPACTSASEEQLMEQHLFPGSG
jgi:hemerythrin